METDSLFVVGKISIVGNHRTKASIILREINFHSNDTLSINQVPEILEKARLRIFNTGLFILVEVTPDLEGNILIKVKERFYTIPSIIFELADRNFNEWWVQHHHNINRTNYGIYLIQKNVRGRNETLRLRLQEGFTRKAEVFYSFPYISKNQRIGLNLSFSYIYSKWVAYQLDNQKLTYLKEDKFLINRIYTGAQFVYRKKYYTWQALEIQYNHQNIADTIANLNPNYFGNHRTRRNYFVLSYVFVHDRRDIQYYALKGHYFKAEVIKTGLGIFNDINILSLRSEYGRFVSLGKNFFFATDLTGRVSFPSSQPFYNNKALGYYDDLVRGYELYVINGQHFALSNNSLKFRIFNKTRNFPLMMNQFSTMPLSIFLTANFDAGYVRDARPDAGNKLLSNTLLAGGGLGIDIVTFYDIVFRTEYSINRMKQKGIYLHFTSFI